MRLPIQEVEFVSSPELLGSQLHHEPGFVLLSTGLFGVAHALYSFVAARPFLTFRSHGSLCQLMRRNSEIIEVRNGNPWCVLEDLMRHCELLKEADVPFPLGGCFGYWGYDLKNFVEPRLGRRASNDLGLPDCQVGFYDSLLVIDHQLGRTWIVSTGLGADGERNPGRATAALEFWRSIVDGTVPPADQSSGHFREGAPAPAGSSPRFFTHFPGVASSFSRETFIARVERARDYIRCGDIYQVNLSQRLELLAPMGGWEFFQRLGTVSPAPFSAYMNCGDFEIASSSPELFLRISGREIETRPIKGTRPRSSDPTRDAQLGYELQTSSKEMAELVMITDLLRNDLGKVCEYGMVSVPELVRLERYAQVQHLVSTVTGRLRPNITHLEALASAFPGGSITGAPKIRAMEIIDELEPVSRGPYTGALGYLGFNRESQLSIIIRAAVRSRAGLHFHVGAGIVADSDPVAEYNETLAKAGGFLAAVLRELGRDATIARSGLCSGSRVDQR